MRMIIIDHNCTFWFSALNHKLQNAFWLEYGQASSMLWMGNSIWGYRPIFDVLCCQNSHRRVKIIEFSVQLELVLMESDFFFLFSSRFSSIITIYWSCEEWFHKFPSWLGWGREHYDHIWSSHHWLVLFCLWWLYLNAYQEPKSTNGKDLVIFRKVGTEVL